MVERKGEKGVKGTSLIVVLVGCTVVSLIIVIIKLFEPFTWRMKGTPYCK
jgi:hypothetical protein